jgi:hypothetical protein
MNLESTPAPREPAAAPVWWTALLGLYVSSIYGIMIGALLALWPVVQDGVLQPVAFWPGPAPAVPLDLRYLLITALCGALGSYIHIATSFTQYSGQRRLVAAWGWWYILRPSIGSGLALLVYFVLRAGLISGSGEAATAGLSPYGVSALAGLSGLFSRQATEKLREVFENLCKTEKPVAGEAFTK